MKILPGQYLTSSLVVREKGIGTTAEIGNVKIEKTRMVTYQLGCFHNHLPYRLVHLLRYLYPSEGQYITGDGNSPLEASLCGIPILAIKAKALYGWQKTTIALVFVVFDGDFAVFD